jgi:integrase
MMDAYCSKPALKTAFMFGCFTGCRYSDIMAMKWRNVIMDGANWRLEFNQVKTGEFVSIPLTKMAILYLPKYKKSYSKERNVFERIEPQAIKTYLARWAQNAGITKHLTFHMSRHTFACLSIEAGIDIYTIGKLLGHRSIKSTQVYSDVMDGRKEAAVSLLDKLDLLKDLFDDDTEE